MPRHGPHIAEFLNPQTMFCPGRLQMQLLHPTGLREREFSIWLSTAAGMAKPACGGTAWNPSSFSRRITFSSRYSVTHSSSISQKRLHPTVRGLPSFSDAHETTAIPLIAANMHRVIRPGQSQIWAVLRAGDSRERLYYSLISTFLGRMCLSGDIYDLSPEQWEIVDQGMAFYRMVSDIIRSDSPDAPHRYPAGKAAKWPPAPHRCHVRPSGSPCAPSPWTPPEN